MAPAFLVQSVAILVSAALIAYLSQRIGLVPIVGFLIAGVVIGPYALRLVGDPALVNASAEIGVILLLFTIGIEFSLEKLAAIKGLIFGGGGLQVTLASLGTWGILAAFGVEWRAALFSGFLISLSSTAIVLKLLADRGATESIHGQVTLGLLIFQDLAVIVMVLVVPMLGGSGGSAAGIVWALAKALALISVILVVARRLMPRLLERVALTCSPEIFLLTLIAICFGTAALTSVAGVSLSLGAFLAGLMVSESRFSHHAFGEIMPLQILFSATFFVSVGMLVDVGFLLHHLPLVLAAVAGVLVLKALTTTGSILALGYNPSVAIASGLTLAQIGEFSFVLERAGREVGLSPAGLGETGSQTLIAASVLLMVATPQLTDLGARLGKKMTRRRVKTESKAAERAEVAADTFNHLQNHVVIAGYGAGARHVARALHESSVPFVITTLSPGGANEAEALGFPVLRGDSGRQHTLELAGIVRARTVVVVDDDRPTTQRIVAIARSLAPQARIIARVRRQADAAALRVEGGDLVVVDELESIVQVSDDALRQHGVPADAIARQEHEIRHATFDSAIAHSGEEIVDAEHLVRFTPDPKSECGHLASIRDVRPSAPGCEECLKIGDTWVHLRLCLTCGHVGCCDTSKNKHATGHYHATTHPIVKSLERGERWGWCYVDTLTIQPAPRPARH